MAIAAEPKKKAVMYKPLQCGCCDDYAAYLERHGFEVEIKSLRSLAEIKRESGVPKGFEGCHTLLVEGYTVDGLVPIRSLSDDYYVYDPVGHYLEGRRRHRKFRLADSVEVVLVGVDTRHRGLDLSIIGGPPAAKL